MAKMKRKKNQIRIKLINKIKLKSRIQIKQKKTKK